MRFEQWLGELLSQDQFEVRRLLQNPAALHFLIAWSLFESKCFDGYVKIDKLEAFAARLVAESYDSGLIAEAASHFHARYQDKERYRQLMHRQPCKRMDALVQRQLESVRPEDSIFIVALVLYRFRNNMFHGNKGVQSWLQFTKQILLCTDAMQGFVSHAESMRPSLREREVA